ncbi:protease complex subunit PrcB family protein [Bacillus cereus]|uniref:protease complex subunit PrcB family protein n=1 Tax=Bacillus cereus TaxID=1396 RepID=UPI002406276A|nr:protease complex subunit PrcB family protein [Bacillus cereus]MDF9599002.1 protease complex subunit PrcB family protein [Bacillus cereus]MDG1589335.1 protease complex subunit PrcB family protein [Bacillus cereus]
MISKRKLGIMLLLSITTSVFVGCSNENTLMKKDTWTVKELKTQKEIKYELLDESVLNESVLNEGEMKSWYEKASKEKGVHSKTDKEYTYIVIADGKKFTTGYGIELFDVRKVNKEIVVGYNVVEPEKNTSIEEKESYPRMILRIKAEDGKIVGKKIKEK